MTHGPEVVSLGEAMVELSATEPGPLRASRHFEVGWGGDTSNFAVAVRRLGHTSGYVTKLGDDEFGASLMDLWSREGVDTSGVDRIASGFTAAYFLSRGAPGEHGFTYFRDGSAASMLQPDDLPVDYIRRARVFHTSGITQAISASACDATFRAIREAKEAGVLTTYDPNVRPKLWPVDRARAIVLHTIGMVDVAIPSLEEARVLTGVEEPDLVAEELLSLGPHQVVVKLGDQGAVVADDDGVRHVEGYKVDAVDAAGAGDTFDAGFVVGTLEGFAVEDAVDFANAAAALTTTGVGCVAPIPERERVEDLRAA
jgi:2-dehydro-3-deoxygluconokinase